MNVMIHREDSFDKGTRHVIAKRCFMDPDLLPPVDSGFFNKCGWVIDMFPKEVLIVFVPILWKLQVDEEVKITANALCPKLQGDVYVMNRIMHVPKLKANDTILPYLKIYISSTNYSFLYCTPTAATNEEMWLRMEAACPGTAIEIVITGRFPYLKWMGKKKLSIILSWLIERPGAEIKQIYIYSGLYHRKLEMENYKSLDIYW